MINAGKLRKDFPALQQEMNGHRIAYLDNAATTQKPQNVIERIERFYTRENANVGRSMHELAGRTSQVYRESRETIADFMNADEEEIVFKKNTTDAMNFLARSLDAEGKIAVSKMSHHSTMLPFRKKAEREHRKIEYLPMENYVLDVESAKEIIDSDTGIVALGHVSNVFGTENDVKAMAEIAHDHGAKVVVDGAQGLPRKRIDVKDLGADFYAFSGHKMLGPMGSGGVYGRRSELEKLSPSDYGGGMISKVTRNTAEWRESPARFEAGTPDVAAAAGLAEALRYLDGIGMEEIERHEKDLVSETVRELEELKNVEPLAAEHDISLVSIQIENVHPHDVAEIFNQEGIAVRAGKHCAHPLMERLGVSGTLRISPYLYNTREDMERALDAVKKTVEVFG